MANAITTVRLALVLYLTSLIDDPASAWTVVVVATIAALSDLADGWIARRTGATPFGARFDMEVDALLIVVLSVMVWQWGKAGAWVLLSGAMRYLFVAAGLFAPRLQAPLFPSLRRKTVCVVQIVALIVALGPIVPAVLSAPLAAIGLALLGYSFAMDTWWLLRTPGDVRS